jgi:DNA polymerase-3 subunit gamma/tau
MHESHVIARRFRPQRFDQVIGQEAIVRTLRNAIKSRRIHHAYLFAGARGVGKTTMARILAKALNCARGITPEPCDQCPSCLEIASSCSIDVLEIDAASNTGVDNVRETIINGIAIRPARDRYKIFIIDEVHQLSAAAFNALLKTLEEPPPHAVFIMATTELHKVPETITSRCQVFQFRTISTKSIFDELRRIANQMGINISEGALAMIARAGEGSMRDAESALDQVISFAGKDITEEDVSAALGLIGSDALIAVLEAVAREDARSLVQIVDEAVGRGYDLRNFCRELMAFIRALLIIRVVGFDRELLQLPPGLGETLNRLASIFSEQDLIRYFSIISKLEQDIRLSPHPRFQLEVGLMKLAQARRLYLLEDAIKRLEDIASRLPEGNPTPEPEPEPAPADDPPQIQLDLGQKIKASLESKNKMLLVSVLDKADIHIEGNKLHISFSAEDRAFKSQVESRENRRLIEEIAEHLTGRKLSLQVSIKEAAARKASSLTERVQKDPKVRALIDRFKGEITEVEPGTEPT